MTLVNVTAAQYGTVQIVDNQIQYNPNKDFNGEDKISYTISDSNGGEITKELIITVNAVNDAPVLASTIDNQEIQSG